MTNDYSHASSSRALVALRSARGTRPPGGALHLTLASRLKPRCQAPYGSTLLRCPQCLHVWGFFFMDENGFFFGRFADRCSSYSALPAPRLFVELVTATGRPTGTTTAAGLHSARDGGESNRDACYFKQRCMWRDGGESNRDACYFKQRCVSSACWLV